MDLANLRLDDLLDQVAAKSPAPGGGAVASAAGALAAALAGMVVSYSTGKRGLEEHAETHQRAESSLRRAREMLLRLAAEDAEAYETVNRLLKKDADPKERAERLPGGVQAAIAAPMATMATCVDLLRLFETLAPASNVYLLSDLGIAGDLAEATARACRWNVCVNLPLLKKTNLPAGEEEAARIREQMEAMLADAARLNQRVAAICRGD